MKVEHLNKEKRFVVYEEDDSASLNYGLRGKTTFFMHTKVPEKLEGKGIGTALVEHALAYAKTKGYKIAVLCPFNSRYERKHPEWYAYYDREYHQNVPSSK